MHTTLGHHFSVSFQENGEGSGKMESSKRKNGSQKVGIISPPNSCSSVGQMKALSLLFEVLWRGISADVRWCKR